LFRISDFEIRISEGGVAMISVILATVSRVVLPVLILFSLHLLLRGHNEPGGGFIAGLMTAAAFVLQYIAYNNEYVRTNVRLNYRALLATGLALAGGTGVAAFFYGSAFLEHRFAHFRVPLLGDVELTTALAFDVGVYCVVVGVTLMVISTLGEQQKPEEET
jgi:multicomponent K+:H+ antiporter subunit A